MGKKKYFTIKYLILVVAIIFIIVGVFNGEINTVYKKASKICLECIGLG